MNVELPRFAVYAKLIWGVIVCFRETLLLLHVMYWFDIKTSLKRHFDIDIWSELEFLNIKLDEHHHKRIVRIGKIHVYLEYLVRSWLGICLIFIFSGASCLSRRYGWTPPHRFFTPLAWLSVAWLHCHPITLSETTLPKKPWSSPSQISLLPSSPLVWFSPYWVRVTYQSKIFNSFISLRIYYIYCLDYFG